uniref:Pre-mRNA-splicing factor CWC22 homolog (Trinotate prediction) n=1 Tax=Henneguya salminicola TaxID=69463 RepID=A0A6G3MED6_HENSL
MRVQYMIEVMFAVRKDKYKDYEIIAKELDLVEEEDQITHLLRLNDQGSTEDELNVFIYDPLYEDTENKYHEIKTDILGSSSDEELNEEEENEIEHDIQEEISDSQPIIDQTFTNTINLRRTIYLLVQSSLDFEECAHKLLKMKLMPAQEHEFCSMLMDCCIQQRTYEKFYGLLCERLCLLKKEFMECFMSLYKEHYETCHRLDSVKLRNASLLFAHLLYSDAIPWTVVRLFVKMLRFWK